MIPGAIRKLRRRLEELTAIGRPQLGFDVEGQAVLLASKLNATITDVFGVGTVEARDFRMRADWFCPPIVAAGWGQQAEWFIRGRDRAVAVIEAAIERLQEKAYDAEQDSAERTLRAYEGLDLHPDIARVVSELYRNRHFANAIEDAVKALNNLVRLRSGEVIDGMATHAEGVQP